MWPQVAGMIESAIEYFPGRYDLGDILEDIIAGRQKLWIAFDEETGEIAGCCTTKIYPYPMSKTMTLEWIAGSNMEEWLPMGFKLIRQYSKDQGCDRMEGRGRDGWLKPLEKLGWKKCASVFEIELE